MKEIIYINNTIYYTKKALIGEHNQKPFLAVSKEVLIDTVFWKISHIPGDIFVINTYPLASDS